MASADQIIVTYRELADSYQEQGQAQMRDRFLVLAADSALSAGRADEAERLRFRLLQYNPQHLLKPYGSLAEALQSQDVQNYLMALRRSHPYERAEHLLKTIRASRGRSEAGCMPPPSRGLGRPEAAVSRGDSTESPDELKIYRVQQTETPTTNPFRVNPLPSAKSAAKGKALPVRTPSIEPSGKQAASKFDIYPLERQAVLPGGFSSMPSDLDEREQGAGSWVALGLFWLMLAGSSCLAIYVLLRPLLARAL